LRVNLVVLGLFLAQRMRIVLPVKFVRMGSASQKQKMAVAPLIRSAKLGWFVRMGSALKRKRMAEMEG
jgi:hypothetical protein